MTYDETVKHFEDLGVLTHVAPGPEGAPLIIFACAEDYAVAQECMQPFMNDPSYSEGAWRIDAETTDEVLVAVYVDGNLPY